jgi:hypothetical protein
MVSLRELLEAAVRYLEQAQIQNHAKKKIKENGGAPALVPCFL